MRGVFALAEFRALWTAQLLSVAGDQFARVALTLLVYQRTRSALLAAVAYAATIAPVFIGGVFLSGIADRWPRRTVMIACDLARAPLTALIAVPGVPTAAQIGLLCAVTALGAPFGSARAAIYPDVLGDDYPLGVAVTMTTYQAAQVLGFVSAAAVVSLAGARAALFADAGTFLASALAVALWVHRRPAPRPARAHGSALAGISATVRLTLGRQSVRTPMLLGWISWAYNVPEGLAAPLAKATGGGPAAVGAILAAVALGSSTGAITLTRLAGPVIRQRLNAPLAFAACAILAAVALRPGLPVILVILLVSGLCDSYQVQANAAFVAAVPDSQRGQAFGLALGGMQLGQGTAMVIAGAAAQHAGPQTVIAIAGAAGAAVALLVSLSSRRGSRLAPSGVPHGGPPVWVSLSSRRGSRLAPSGVPHGGPPVWVSFSSRERITSLAPSGVPHGGPPVCVGSSCYWHSAPQRTLQCPLPGTRSRQATLTTAGHLRRPGYLAHLPRAGALLLQPRIVMNHAVAGCQPLPEAAEEHSACDFRGHDLS